MGKDPKDIKYIQECKCGTVFTYQQEDIVDDRDGPYITCPCCKKCLKPLKNEYNELDKK